MTLRRRLLLLGGAALALGCVLVLIVAVGHMDIRRVRGPLQSKGPGYDTWSATPTSCALDPQDGRPAAESSTRVTLVWLDPEAGDQTRYLRWFTSPDTPVRLDLIAWPQGSQHATLAVLETIKHDSPLVLDASVCTRLELETGPEAPLVREGRAALHGTLRLECASAGRQLSGTIRFDHCSY